MCFREPPLSANTRELINIPNIVFLVTGIYFAIVAAAGQASIYVAIAAVFCFIAVGLSFMKDWVFSAPWRLATAAFSIVILLAQLGVDFSVSNASGAVVVSVLLNGALFVLMLGVLLFIGKDLTASEHEEETEEEEETETPKKKKLTYEI